MKLPLTLLLAALLVPLAVQPAHAQDVDPSTRILEDRGGDLRVSVGGTDQDPSGHWQAADLKALDVTETSDEITFRLTVASLAPDTGLPFVEDLEYDVSFRHLDQVYRVHMSRSVQFGTYAYAYLEAYNPARQRYEQRSFPEDVLQDATAGTLSYSVRRDLLVDRDGNAPHPEVPFTEWQAQATSYPVFGNGVTGICLPACVPQPTPAAHDAMPDQGNGTVPLPIRFGISQTGHAHLSSPTPTRASNGEATTIVYQVEAQNRGPRNETFSLTASGVPGAWIVRLPAARVTIPANGSVLLPVLLSVPFAHAHGTYQKFLVELTSLADPGSVGRIQLGIRYADPPQPAGHHDDLYLHTPQQASRSVNPALDPLLYGTSGAYMNALVDDPLDAKAEVPGFNCRGSLSISSGGPQAQVCWFVDLKPQLELGLDFDLARVGTLTLPIRTELPMTGAQLTGNLYYVAPGDGFRFEGFAVATLRPAAPQDLAPHSSGNILKADVVPTPEGDFVTYRRGSALYLEILVNYAGQSAVSFNVPATAPMLQPGGILSDLPLNEYHDPVDALFASNSTLHLLATSLQDRPVNPGKTVLFNLTLENGGAAGLFDLALTGTHLPWARIVSPGPQVRLGEGGSVPVQVAVQVPQEADQGDTADLVLAATLSSDLNVRSLARLFATVDTRAQHPDEAGLLADPGKAKGTPTVAFGLLAAAIVAVAAARRRRD
ncbi:MAG TPA: hypothetical protein VM286_09665 [Candidatus Thermoplasmatota archaeon]|nr:hypothetical protein [Candidatus Thermoplasmatota archaeon]